MSAELAGRLCRASAHVHPPTAAVIVGTFDASSGLEDGWAQPGTASCLRCAALDHAAGWFVPDDPDDVAMLMDHHDFIRREEHRPESETPR